MSMNWSFCWALNPKDGFRLSEWDESLFTMRAILKQLRSESPFFEFRSRTSRTNCSYGVKYIESRLNTEKLSTLASRNE